MAATPPITGAQSLPDFCHVDNVAFEPPVPTTEITWLALPTRPANHGASARCAVVAGPTTAAGRGIEELVAADDLVTLLADGVVVTVLETGSVDELATVTAADVDGGASEAPTERTSGDPLADTTTTVATAVAATTGHRTLTARGTFARRRNIPLSLRKGRP